MQADGRAPLGAALDIATDLIEDRERVPSRANRPTVVLVSDGLPNDEWEGPLQRLLTSERVARAERFALGIGADADRIMLRRFLNDPEGRVFEAHEGREIRKFFRWVTMSVSSRSRSAEPHRTADVDPPDLDDYGDIGRAVAPHAEVRRPRDRPPDRGAELAGERLDLCGKRRSSRRRRCGRFPELRPSWNQTRATGRDDSSVAASVAGPSCGRRPKGRHRLSRDA